MSRQTVLNMLLSRGYNIVDEKEFLNSDSEKFLTSKITEDNSKIFVFFPETTAKVGVFAIRQYIIEMNNEGVNNAIIIVKDDMTAFAKQEFANAKGLNIKYYKEKELLMDKTKHVIVPEHRLIKDEEEKKELLKIYKVKESQLPRIQENDPMSRHFGAKKGQVFEIKRFSETCGNSIYYRIVV